MFSSNNHTSNENGVYPLALYLSPFSNHDENISASYNHHHYNQQNLHPTDPLMAAPHHQFSSPTVPESLINYMAFSSNNVTMEQNLVNGGGCSDQIDISRGIKKPVKKDRHSKIHTAQGLRDRRVRLSIGIARQFFDLQDMLGFDKASKTLEWLLKKSRKAIREVVRAKKLNSCDFSSTNIEDECYGNNIGDGGEEEEDDDDDDDEDKSFVSGSSSDNCEDLVCETKKPEIGGSLHREKKKKNELSNSRAKGRERAKERAKDITGSKNTDTTETDYEVTHSQILDSLMSTSVQEGEEKLSARVHGQDMTHSFYKNTIQELNRFPGDYSANQESVYIRRKIKPWTPLVSSYGQQHEGVILKDQSSSSNNITIMPQNWHIYDQNPFVDSPYCALSNMNMSTGLQ